MSSTLTRQCIACSGMGTLPGGPPCSLCRGTGSQRTPMKATPPPTLASLQAHVLQLQRAVLLLLDVEPIPLVSRRKVLSEILAEIEKVQGTR